MRQYNIKSIPTIYRGTEFRSKLESEWAKHFDELGIEWEYEKQTYLVGGMYYLPDFFIKNWIIEIKPTSPTSEEKFKCRHLSIWKNTALFAGHPNNAQVWMWQNGYSVDIQYPSMFGLKCFIKGISPIEAANYLRLKYVLRKGELC